MASAKELKYLSERRLEAVELLNNNSINDIAYQDSGYIIEFALKAAICKFIDSEYYPDDIAKNNPYRTHHFDSLVKLAGLSEELAKKKATDRKFMKNWSITTKWSVALRYQPIGENQECVSKAFIDAIKTEKGGVLQWLKIYW